MIHVPIFLIDLYKPTTMYYKREREIHGSILFYFLKLWFCYKSMVVYLVFGTLCFYSDKHIQDK